MTDRLTDAPLFVWRTQILEGSKVPDAQKHSFCFEVVRKEAGRKTN